MDKNISGDDYEGMIRNINEVLEKPHNSVDDTIFFLREKTELQEKYVNYLKKKNSRLARDKKYISRKTN